MTAKGIFDEEGIVTSEAVEIDLPAASLPLRVASGAIDIAVIIGLLALTLWLAPWEVIAPDAALMQAAVILFLVLAVVGLATVLETALHGRTLGKLALGLRTVREDAGPIGFRHALIRALCWPIEVLMTGGSVAVLVAMSNTRGKRLGDFAAGTYVVRDRVPLVLAPPAQMPPELVPWAQSADIGVLPDALVVAARQFLARGAALHPQARADQAERLAADLVRFVAPPPPTRHPLEAVISAVLSERRRRDLLRLERDDALRARVLGPDPLP